MKAGKFKDILITSLIKACGYSAIIFVGMIFVFLIKEGSPALITDRHARSRNLLRSTRSR